MTMYSENTEVYRCTFLAGSVRPPLLPLQGGRDGKGATSLVQHLSQNGVGNTIEALAVKLQVFNTTMDIIGIIGVA